MIICPRKVIFFLHHKFSQFAQKSVFMASDVDVAKGGGAGELFY